MARRVEDLILLMPILSGPDYIDAAIVPMPWPDPAKVDLKSLRVAFYTDNGEGAAKPTPEVIAMVEQVVGHFRELGCTVTAATPPDVLLITDISRKLREGDGNAWQKRLIEKYKTTVPGPNRRFDYPLLPTSEFTKLIEDRDAWRSKMISWVKEFDVIISPAALGPAQVIGERTDPPNPPGSSFTSTYNLTGWPSGVVRAATSPEKMPLGVMVTAQPWREDVVLAAMLFIEGKTGGWQKPPL
jgi:amidase